MDIREYILIQLNETGRPIRKKYKRSVRRKRHQTYKRKRAQIIRRQRMYRKSTAYKQWKRRHKKRVARSSYRPVKRIYT